MASNGSKHNGAKRNGQRKIIPRRSRKNGKPTASCSGSATEDNPKHCVICNREVCGARRINCRCGYHFTSEEYEVLYCPQCKRLRFCLNHAIYPSGRCRKHGGASPSGPDHPNYVSGRFSLYWSRIGLGADYEALRKSDLMDAETGLANLQLRQFILTEGGLPTKETLERIKESFATFEAAAREHPDDLALLNKLLKSHHDVIDEGVSANERWEEFAKLEEQMDKKRERIEKRAINAKLLVNIEYVRGLCIRLIYANQAEIRAKFRELQLPTHEADDLIAKIGFEFTRQLGELIQPSMGSSPALIESQESAD